MVAEVFAGLSAFKSMLDSAKALSQMHDDSIRLQASIDLQRQLFEAQQAYQTLAEEKRAAEAEVVRLRDWAAERERYELKEHGHRKVLAYALKENEQDSGPAHSLCPNCFAGTKKSILQPERRIGGAEVLNCHACGFTGWISGFAERDPPRRR